MDRGSGGSGGRVARVHLEIETEQPAGYARRIRGGTGRVDSLVRFP
jgi:hypothetical protein